jgi:Transglycosylase SLT domain
MKILKTLKIIIIFIMMVFPCSAFSNECMQAINNVIKKHSIPKDILTAVALTETGTRQNGYLAPYPWAINVEGKGFLFPNKQQAIDAVKFYLSQGKTSIDIGCMQLNWYWHKDKFNNSVEKAFEPLDNITAGAKYLEEHYKTYGNWNQAVGRYHSGTAKFADAYQQKYAMNLKIVHDNKNASDNSAILLASNTNSKDIPTKKNTPLLPASAGSLIIFQAIDSQSVAVIDMEKKSVPFIDTDPKEPWF